MTKSFGLKTVADYFRELLEPAFQEFEADTDSPRKAITCAIFLWHLHDWIFQQHPEILKSHGLKTKKEFQRFLCKETEEFQILSAVANGSKHFQLDYPSSVTDTGVKHGYMRGPMIIFGTVSHLYVKYGDKDVTFIVIVRKCREFWFSFLNESLNIWPNKPMERTA